MVIDRVIPPIDPHPACGYVVLGAVGTLWTAMRAYVEQLRLFDPSPWEVRKRWRWRLARRARAGARGLLILAGGLIFDDDDRILLIHRSTANLVQWETPGGKVDTGETPEQAAQRELYEELGVEVDLVADLGAHDFVAAGQQMRYALFKMRTRGEPRLRESAFDQLRFFSWTELAQMTDELSPNVRNIVELQVRGRLKHAPVAVGSASTV